VIRIKINSLENFSPDGKNSEKNITELISKILDHAISVYKDGEENKFAVDLLVVDDEEITAMNFAYKNRNNPTDVLAFYDGDEEGEGKIHLGDVMISSDTAKREADGREVPFFEELSLYALHGVLHLLGFRDGTDEERKTMRAAERAVLFEFDIIPHWG
jgi:probable rRNA maturation factor